MNDPVTWIKVNKPVFDLAGVLLSSLTLTGVLAIATVVLGFALGVYLIRRAQRRPSGMDGSLHLEVRP